MSQGQHLKSNKNTEDKIALFHCRFGERGSFNVNIYNRSCRSSIFLYIKRNMSYIGNRTTVVTCALSKLQDEMVINKRILDKKLCIN